MAEPIPKVTLPRAVETRDHGLIYKESTAEWFHAWQTVFRKRSDLAAIDISTAGSHTIIGGVAGNQIRIVSIALTVGEITGDEEYVSITLMSGGVAISGPMQFSGSVQPRGIVIPFPFAPLGLEHGLSFGIYVSANAQVSGMVCYFYQ